jgi:tetratricopeptide (TPR) repeat protein
MPRAYAAWVHEKRISLRLPSITPADHDTCVRLAHQALQLGGDDPLIRAIASMVLYRTTNDAAAVHGLAQAVEDNPHNVVILNLAGITHLLKGNADEAYRCRARAYALSPGAPDAYQSLHGMGAAELLRGNYDAAIDWCLKSLAVYSDWIFPHYTLTACYVLLGRLDEARATVRRIRDLNPALTLASFRDGIDPCDDAYGDMVIPMLGPDGTKSDYPDLKANGFHTLTKGEAAVAVTPRD